MNFKGQSYYNKVRTTNFNFDLFFKLFDVTENGQIFKNGKEIKIYTTLEGYKTIDISNSELGRFRYSIHRLVALKYCKKPDHLKEIDFSELSVNHKDGNKANNHYTNLEWCTVYENNKHVRDNKLNDISKSNHERWKDEEFALKVKANMRKMRKLNPLDGRKNPRFKYDLVFEGQIYTIKEIAEKLSISPSRIYRYIYTNDSRLNDLGIKIIFN